MDGRRIRLASDRVDPDVFYATARVDDSSSLFVSRDGGESFEQSIANLPRDARPRTVFANQGHVWLVTPLGLMVSEDGGDTMQAVEGVDSARALGFGKSAPGQDYPALYLSGLVGGEPGLFRSDDRASSWQPIDDEAHRFGWLGHVTGDPRIYGRVYVGTGGRGILYGDPLD
jgi:photosystem II stability/assembly factor-like uncharacterized protein